MDVEPMLRHRPCREVGTGTERGRATNRGGAQPHEEAVAQLSAESRALEVQEATGTSMHQPDLWEAYMTAQILAL